MKKQNKTNIIKQNCIINKIKKIHNINLNELSETEIEKIYAIPMFGTVQFSTHLQSLFI